MNRRIQVWPVSRSTLLMTLSAVWLTPEAVFRNLVAEGDARPWWVRTCFVWETSILNGIYTGATPVPLTWMSLEDVELLVLERRMTGTAHDLCLEQPTSR